MRITVAQPCAYNYKTGETRPTGEPVGAETLATINHEGWEPVCRVTGDYNRIIWHASPLALAYEGQHYLARVEG